MTIFVELYGDGKCSGKGLYVEIEHFVSSKATPLSTPEFKAGERFSGVTLCM
jgi:hypothetical protein